MCEREQRHFTFTESNHYGLQQPIKFLFSTESQIALYNLYFYPLIIIRIFVVLLKRTATTVQTITKHKTNTERERERKKFRAYFDFYDDCKEKRLIKASKDSRAEYEELRPLVGIPCGYDGTSFNVYMILRGTEEKHFLANAVRTKRTEY